MNIVLFGATGGIGMELARSLAKEGHTLVIHGRNEGRLTKIYDELDALTRVYALPLDFMKIGPADTADINSLIQQSIEHIDAIIFCAGYAGPRSPVVHYAPHEWLKVMQINLNAPFLLTKSLWNLLTPNAKVIFTLSPQVYEHSSAYWSGYSASKHGLQGLIKALQHEYADSQMSIYGYDPICVATALHHNAYPGLPKVRAPAEVVQGYLDLLKGKENAALRAFYAS